MESLPFDNMVELYDQTRTVEPWCLASAIDFICSRFPPSGFASLFEPGIGTGRIALPLAERGYHVTGVDISEAMLSLLKRPSCSVALMLRWAMSLICRSGTGPSR